MNTVLPGHNVPGRWEPSKQMAQASGAARSEGDWMVKDAVSAERRGCGGHCRQEHLQLGHKD